MKVCRRNDNHLRQCIQEWTISNLCKTRKNLLSPLLPTMTHPSRHLPTIETVEQGVINVIPVSLLLTFNIFHTLF